MPPNFDRAKTDPSYMSGAQTCAQTGSGCAGYEVGTSSTCQYPLFGFGASLRYARAGWAMWQISPQECRYAMKATYL